MRFEEVARQDRPLSRSPDTEPNLEKFKQEYLEDQNAIFAEISNIVSGAYEI